MYIDNANEEKLDSAKTGGVQKLSGRHFVPSVRLKLKHLIYKETVKQSWRAPFGFGIAGRAFVHFEQKIPQK